MKKKTNKENTKKTNIAVVVALIGLIGTVITAIFTSPVLIAWLQKETVNLTETPDFSTTPIQNTPSLEPDSAFTWFGEPITELDFYTTDMAQFSFSSATGLDVTSRYSNDRVWLNKILPEDFSIEISFIQLESKCLMYVGFGDGQHDKNSYAWFLYENTASFVKNIGGEDVYFVEKAIKYIITNQISSYILERIEGNIILKDANGKVIFRIKPIDKSEWSDINEFDTFWFYGGGSNGQVCTIRYTNLKVSEIK